MVLLVTVLPGGCTGSGGVSAVPRSARGRWTVSAAQFGVPGNVGQLRRGPYVQRAIAVPGGWAALGSIDERDFAGWRSVDGVHWKLGQHNPATRADSFPRVHVIVQRGRDLLAAGSSLDQPAVWVSRDFGSSWSRSRASALDASGVIDDALVVRGSVVLVGHHGSNLAKPAAWSTRDLVHVDAASVPSTTEPDAWMGGVTDLGSELLAVGAVHSHPATWSSIDGGRSWRLLPAQGFDVPGHLNDVIALHRHLVASGDYYPKSGSGEPQGGFAWQATKDATSWKPVPRRTGSFGDGFATRAGNLVAFRGAAMMIGSAHDRANANFCYDDLATCDRFVPSAWLSSDGENWARIATPDVTDAGFNAVVIDASGFLIIGQHRASIDGPSMLRIWRWTAPDGETPTAAVPPDPQPKPPPHELITSYTARLAIGRTYRFVVPIGGGCGSGLLSFNSTTWQVDQAWGETPYPKEWPVKHRDIIDGPTDYLYGTVRLLDDRHLQVAIEGGRTLRTYEPTTQHQAACG